MFIVISIFFASIAQGQSRPECYEQIKSFNAKFKTSEFVFANMSNEGDWLFYRVKPGRKAENDEVAAQKSVTRNCIKAGFSNNILIGELGVDRPKTYCQILNLTIVSFTCEPFFKKANPEIIRLK